MKDKKPVQEDQKQETTWLKTQADINCKLSKDKTKILFFLNNEKNEAFSYHVNYFKKLLEKAS